MTPQISAIIRTVSAEIRKALPDVIAVYHFGSTAQPEGVARVTEESDLDLAFLSAASPDSKAVAGLRQSLIELVGRGVDLINLRNADSVIIHQILETGLLVFSADPKAVAVFETAEMGKYCDLNDERREILEDVRKRGKIRAG